MSKYAYLMLSIIEYTYSPCISFYMNVLNARFCSKVGNKAYPWQMLFYDGFILFNDSVAYMPGWSFFMFLIIDFENHS